MQPTAKTVPWVATNPLLPHTIFSGESTTLKGTTDVQGANFEYTWDFGDGSPVFSATVTNQYALEAVHTYTGAVGTIFVATLTVRDTDTGESNTKNYFVEVRTKELSAEVNRAIDEGLWYLHKTQRRDGLFAGSGDWNAGFAGGSFAAYWANNVTAFEVNGHLETGAASNPYTETVSRGLKAIFSILQTRTITLQNNAVGMGLDPDVNGNGYGVYVNQVDPYYQSGTVVDAIVATGTPNAVTTTGKAPAAPDPGILGRTYADIVQDIVDHLSWGQSDNVNGGGWQYVDHQGPDNSSNQWVAISFIAAERNFGATVPDWVAENNEIWLGNSQQTEADAQPGVFGYTSKNPIWGPTGTTPSGMVQLAWQGIGRGDIRWDRSEDFMRELFPDPLPATDGTNEVLDNYYGLLSFTKALHLHDSNGDKVAEPITLLGGDLDWYEAQVSQGDVADGVARTLVGDQVTPGTAAGGYWTQHHAQGSQKWPLETASAIIMLNRTVFEAGVPVAVAQANPNPAVAGAIIQLNGSNSFHQSLGLNIDSWEWDLDNDGTFDVSGVLATVSFPATGMYPVRLRVTDDAVPEQSAVTTITIDVALPPLAPTADAGGPYNFCPQTTPWFLDATGSSNPDEGLSEIGQPGDTIQSYEWELNGNNMFDDAVGAEPDVTAFFQALGEGDYVIQVRVTDTTATSFPSSGQPDLSDTDFATVHVLAADDEICACSEEMDLQARPKSVKVQLTWVDIGAAGYNVYRSTITGGPYVKIGETNSTYATFLDGGPLTLGTPYYYVVRAKGLDELEFCQSLEASATPAGRLTPEPQAGRGQRPVGDDPPGRRSAE
ncbi:MAG TPA: PKD domain-containing protein [Verrucomicrobiales bacterium]|nr:PKD domain-containing protein [Verrucomicrobiales bacterium]